jgi:protein gp37
MSTTTSIEWTDKTWNPVRGCALVSAGCTNCYAMRQAHRFSGAGQPYEGLTRMTSNGPVWTGKTRLVEEALEEPLRWRKPARVFVNSMSDLFHGDVPDEFIDDVLATIAATPEHTYQVLTKRPQRMRGYFADLSWCPPRPQPRLNELLEKYQRVDVATSSPFPFDDDTPLKNLWLGVSIENQEAADERIPILLQTPAAVRFLSVEPLLGPVNLGDSLIRICCREANHPNCNGSGCNGTKLDWIIIGGESGPRSRPCHLDWVRGVVEQCRNAGTPVFVKQLGAVPVMDEEQWRNGPMRMLSAAKRDRYPGAVTLHLNDSKGGNADEWPEDLRIRQWPNQ